MDILLPFAWVLAPTCACRRVAVSWLLVDRRCCTVVLVHLFETSTCSASNISLASLPQELGCSLRQLVIEVSHRMRWRRTKSVVQFDLKHVMRATPKSQMNNHKRTILLLQDAAVRYRRLRPLVDQVKKAAAGFPLTVSAATGGTGVQLSAPGSR